MPPITELTSKLCLPCIMFLAVGRADRIAFQVEIH